MTPRPLRPAAALAVSFSILLFHSAAGAAADDLDSPAQRWSGDGPGGTPSFVRHVVPLLNKAGCSTRSCHGSFQGENGFRLSLFGYDPGLDHRELTDDEGEGPRVDVKRPERSLALLKPLAEVDHDGGQRFDRQNWQHRLLQQWIAGGAPYDPETAPYLDSLALTPSEVHLDPADAGQTVSLRAVAVWSDGSREDVTALTTFQSNDESVASVSEEGSVSVEGIGDTSIVATYAGGVVTSGVFVPNDPPGTFPDFPPNNRADELVAAKLQKLGIHPSGLCSDEQFMRRAFVDVIGTLPTPAEVRRFLDDDAPNKRARLVDELLNRPEYATYWATIFSDWTGNNKHNINTWFKTSWLWQDWLRDKLARNVPYDELVGGIVTATSREGRPLEEYLEENRTVSKNIEDKYSYDDGTYARRETLDQYWLKRMADPDKGMATRTANAFLGVQIQCAECHKHPFDRWTQSDFEGFVSIFRTVKVTALDGTKYEGGRRDYDKIAVYPGVDRRYRKLVEKHPPKILAGPEVPYVKGEQDPRAALWEWMRSPDNPYFAANIANRLWEHHLGRGIVDPVDDFSAANPPSNPQLLDWLARDFMEHGFDLKHLHRRILNSRTYQLTHLPNDTNRTDKRNFSHALVKRMPAEVALDAIVQVTGTELKWNRYAAQPGTRAIGLATASRYGDVEYFLDIFGRPEREQTCACERSTDAALAQALYLINDNDIHSRIADPDGRLPRLLKEVSGDRALIEELYLTALCRYPTEQETQTLLDYVREAPSREAGFQDVMWSLLNVREFLFVK